MSTKDIIPIDQFGEIMWDVLTEKEAAYLRGRMAAERLAAEAAAEARKIELIGGAAFAALLFVIACAAFGIFLIFAALGAPAGAQAHRPPAHFDRPANMDVRVMPLAEMQRKCAILARHQGDRSLIQGCALPNLKRCIVLLPPNAPVWVYHHERAHCNGWRH